MSHITTATNTCDNGSLGDKEESKILCNTCGSCDHVDMKMLPCLHVLCSTCVKKRMPEADNQTNIIYSCPVCHHKIQKTSNDGILNILKNVPSFLLRADPEGVDLHNTNDDGGSDQTTNLEHHQNIQSNGISHPSCVCQAQDAVYKCTDCDECLCEDCMFSKHKGHHLNSLVASNQTKHQHYLSTLLKDLKQKINTHQEGIYCIDRLKTYLTTVRKQIEKDILERSEHLITLIEDRKNSLLKELEDTVNVHVNNYDMFREQFTEQVSQFKFIQQFGDKLIEEGSPDDMASYHTDLSSLCLQQLHQVPDANVDVVSLKLNIPGKGKEHSALEKLFGSLTEGTLLSGNAELVASFNVDMKWPTSIGVCPTKEVVITGKTQSFESDGKALFFDSRGRFHSDVKFDASRAPLDVLPAGDGTVWLSNGQGEILNMSITGRILRKVCSVFQGSGHLGLLSDHSVVAVSSVDKSIKILDQLGNLVKSIIVPVPKTGSNENDSPKLNSITTNSSDDLIIGDTQSGQVIVMDIDGLVKYVYPRDTVNKTDNICQQNNCDPVLRCPSAICCDPFDNILVADFTNDCVHLVSNKGQFLGYLLTKRNGLSCPNCMALDQEGKLYIGQYGGDILIYRYMSCMKKA